jgi:hypothetical protein
MLFIATAFLAWYTYKLRQATVQLASDSVEGNKLADRHHQESLMPICVIRDVEIEPEPQYSGPNTAMLAFRIHNQGLGPAVALNVAVSAVGEGLKLRGVRRATSLDSLQAGEVRESPMKFGEFPIEPDGIVAFIVRLGFLSMFGSWGVCEWHVYQAGKSVLTLALPQAKERASDSLDDKDLPKGYLGL